MNEPVIRCPHCGRRGILILYGMPEGNAVVEQARRGELVIGGCIIEDDNPTHQCSRCHRTWREPAA